MTISHVPFVVRFWIAALAGMFVLAACSSGSSAGGSASTAAANGDTIVIKNFAYTVPASVHPGQHLTVRNEDGVAHTVTAKSAGASGFDVKVGGNASATFSAPKKSGSYAFTCTYHPYMKATLVVK